MEAILQAIEKGGTLGLALVFASLWFMEVKERWRRETEAVALRRDDTRAKIRLVRILTKLYAALSQDDSELDGDDDDAR